MSPLEIIIQTTQAIAKNENDADAYKQRAKVLCQMNQLEEAQKDLDVLVDKLHVEDAEVYQLRGSIRMHYNDKEGALDDFKRAMAINPELLNMLHGEFVGRGKD